MKAFYRLKTGSALQSGPFTSSDKDMFLIAPPRPSKRKALLGDSWCGHGQKFFYKGHEDRNTLYLWAARVTQSLSECMLFSGEGGPEDVRCKCIHTSNPSRGQWEEQSMQASQQ
jgi:hypothetical protein